VIAADSESNAFGVFFVGSVGSHDAKVHWVAACQDVGFFDEKHCVCAADTCAFISLC